MQKLLTMSFFIIVLHFLISCSYESKTSPTIYNGELVNIHDSKSFHTVALTIILSDGSVGDCSGSVVGPKTVLTAAHCFADEIVKSVNVHFGPLKTEARKAIWWNFKGDSVLDENKDLALVELESEIPSFVTPAKIAPKDQGLIQGFLYGYGRESLNDNLEGSFGILRKIELVCLQSSLYQTQAKRCHSVTNEGAARKGDSGGGIVQWYAQDMQATLIGLVWGRKNLITYAIDISLNLTHLQDLNTYCRLKIEGLPCSNSF